MLDKLSIGKKGKNSERNPHPNEITSSRPQHDELFYHKFFFLRRFAGILRLALKEKKMKTKQILYFK